MSFFGWLNVDRLSNVNTFAAPTVSCQVATLAPVLPSCTTLHARRPTNQLKCQSWHSDFSVAFEAKRAGHPGFSSS